METTLTPKQSTSRETASRERRQARYVALEWWRSRSTRNAARKCMHALGVGATLAGTAAGVVHVGGVSKCSSPWACMVCSPTIGERRAVEIDQAINAWMGQGGQVFFVTATLSHKWGDNLVGLLDMLQGSWSRTWNFADGSRPVWYAGQIRAIEITHGRNGFHPHVHSAVFIEPGWQDSAVELLAELRAHRIEWGESVHLYGGTTDVATELSPGWDVRPVTEAGELASYLTKIEGGWGPGLELARGDLKAAARKGTTPAELARQAVYGDQAAEALFKVYEIATAGRKRIVASPGLMARCGVEELTDEQAAEAELADAPVVIVSVPADDWRRIMAAGFTGRLLDDVADLAMGRAGWPWPPDWLVSLPAPACSSA